jgi:hypothetical protein
MFRSVAAIREMYLNQAKVTIVKSSVKVRRYKLCSGVAAYADPGYFFLAHLVLHCFKNFIIS